MIPNEPNIPTRGSAKATNINTYLLYNLISDIGLWPALVRGNSIWLLVVLLTRHQGYLGNALLPNIYISEFDL